MARPFCIALTVALAFHALWADGAMLARLSKGDKLTLCAIRDQPDGRLLRFGPKRRRAVGMVSHAGQMVGLGLSRPGHDL